MLTNDDLIKIGGVVDSKMEKRLGKFGQEIGEKMEKRLGKFGQEIGEKMEKRLDKFGEVVDQKIEKRLRPIKEDVSQIRKDIKTMINFFDREYLELRKRVERIETHLKISVS